MSGRKAQKVYVYEKNSRAKVVDICKSIEEFKTKYFPHYKDTSRLPFADKSYIEVGDYIACANKGGRSGRDIYKEFAVDNHIFTKLGTDLKDDYPVDVYNMRGVKLASFKSLRVANKMLESFIETSTILQQMDNTKDTYRQCGMIFRRADHE